MYVYMDLLEWRIGCSPDSQKLAATNETSKNSVVVQLNVSACL